MNDMRERGRSLTNERNPCAKLDYALADEIRAKYATGEYTHKQLAEVYGVAKSQIGNVIRGKTWVRS